MQIALLLHLQSRAARLPGKSRRGAALFARLLDGGRQRRGAGCEPGRQTDHPAPPEHLSVRGAHAGRRPRPCLRADDDALLAIPSGCDAMRRAGDALKARFDARVFPFSVPARQRCRVRGRAHARSRPSVGLVGYGGCGGRLGASSGAADAAADGRRAVGARRRRARDRPRGGHRNRGPYEPATKSVGHLHLLPPAAARGRVRPRGAHKQPRPVGGGGGVRSPGLGCRDLQGTGMRSTPV